MGSADGLAAPNGEGVSLAPLSPGTVRRYDWPTGVQRLSGHGERMVTYIGIPALEGNTWPLRWYSVPTPTAPHVGAAALHGAVARPYR